MHAKGTGCKSPSSCASHGGAPAPTWSRHQITLEASMGNVVAKLAHAVRLQHCGCVFTAVKKRVQDRWQQVQAYSSGSPLSCHKKSNVWWYCGVNECSHQDGTCLVNDALKTLLIAEVHVPAPPKPVKQPHCYNMSATKVRVHAPLKFVSLILFAYINLLPKQTFQI